MNPLYDAMLKFHNNETIDYDTLLQTCMNNDHGFWCEDILQKEESLWNNFVDFHMLNFEYREGFFKTWLTAPMTDIVCEKLILGVISNIESMYNFIILKMLTKLLDKHSNPCFIFHLEKEVQFKIYESLYLDTSHNNYSDIVASMYEHLPSFLWFAFLILHEDYQEIIKKRFFFSDDKYKVIKEDLPLFLSDVRKQKQRQNKALSLWHMRLEHLLGVGLPPEGDEQWLISFQLTGRCDPNTASLILPEESVLYV